MLDSGPGELAVDTIGEAVGRSADERRAGDPGVHGREECFIADRRAGRGRCVDGSTDPIATRSKCSRALAWFLGFGGSMLYSEMISVPSSFPGGDTLTDVDWFAWYSLEGR